MPSPDIKIEVDESKSVGPQKTIKESEGYEQSHVPAGFKRTSSGIQFQRKIHKMLCMRAGRVNVATGKKACLSGRARVRELLFAQVREMSKDFDVFVQPHLIGQ